MKELTTHCWKCSAKTLHQQATSLQRNGKIIVYRVIVWKCVVCGNEKKYKSEGEYD